MNITHGLRRALQINPNGLASVFGNRRRNWREIGERVPRLAAGLRSLGANPGDRVAILSQNSDRYLELYLATAWAGAVVVPLNIRWSPVENEDAMRDCRANILVVDKTFASVGVALGESPARVEADLCRRRRRTGRNGKLRDAAASKRTDSGRDAYQHRSRRHLLHRRHHRPLEGGHAQPRQSHGQFAELPWRRPFPELGNLPARRADVPSRQRRGDVFAAAQRRLKCDHSGVHSGSRDVRGAERARHRRASGPDHDPDAGRSFRAWLLRLVVSEENHLRRLADQRGGNEQGYGRASRTCNSPRPTA